MPFCVTLSFDIKFEELRFYLVFPYKTVIKVKEMEIALYKFYSGLTSKMFWHWSQIPQNDSYNAEWWRVQLIPKIGEDAVILKGINNDYMGEEELPMNWVFT